MLYNLNFIIVIVKKMFFDHQFIHFANSGIVCNLLAQEHIVLVQSQDLNSSLFDFKDHGFCVLYLVECKGTVI